MTEAELIDVEDTVAFWKQKKKEWQKKYRQQYKHKYYITHHEECCASSRAYHLLNREERNMYRRAQHAAHKEKDSASNRAWRETHSKEIRTYRTEHREERNAQNRARRAANPEKNLAYLVAHREQNNARSRAWYAAHRKEHNAYTRKWQKENSERAATRRKERYNTDVQYRLAVCLRSRLHQALNGKTKRGSAIKDLGCTVAELKTHLESQFTAEMSWKNYGKTPTSWSIDHIRPLCEFDLTDPIQLKEACNWKNLRPLWHIENISRPHPKHGKTPKAI